MIFPGRSFVHPVHTLTNTLTNTINQIIKYYYKHKLESGRSNYHSLQFQSSKLQVAALAVAMGQSHPQSSGELGATRSTASAILDATYWVFLAARPCESRTRSSAELKVASSRASGSDGAVAPPGLCRVKSRTTLAVLPAYREFQ